MTDGVVKQVDPGACPFCGGKNACGVSENLSDNLPDDMSGGKSAESKSCWCFEQKVPKALQQWVPPELKRQACICQACVRDYLNDSEAFRRRFKLSEK